jgi:hypothetical protein
MPLTTEYTTYTRDVLVATASERVVMLDAESVF